MKLTIKKFQVGGEFSSLAVPYIPISASTTAGAYAPAIASGESSKSSSSKESSSKDELTIKDVLKVFDNVKGLAIDVNYVLKDFKKMFEDDTLFSFTGKPSYSSLVNYYLNNIGKFNALAMGKEKYDEARKELIKNNSLDELAVDRNGHLVVATQDGSIDVVSYEEATKGKVKPLTNRELLNLRETKLPFGDTIYSVMTGVSMNSIIEKVNAIVQNMGTTEKHISGYTAKLSEAIKSGLAILRDLMTNLMEAGTMTVDGLYKNSVISKDQKELAQLALRAVLNSLSPQELTLLKVHSLNGNVYDTLSSIIFSRTSSYYSFNPTLLEDLNIDGTKKQTSKEAQEALRDTNPLLMMQMMQGGEQRPLMIQTAEGKESYAAPAKYYSAVPKVGQDTSVEKMLDASGIGGMLQGNGIMFGDLPISRENARDIMYSSGDGVYVALLPCITDTTGNKYVDMSILDKYKEATRDINIEPGTPAYYLELSKKLKEKGLDELLTGSGTLNLDRFLEFLIFRGYTTDRVLEANPQFEDSHYIKEVTDKSIESRMKNALSSKEDGEYNIDMFGMEELVGFWNGWDNVYVGTVYIPLTANQNSPYMAYGLNIKQSIADANETDYLRMQTEKYRKFNSNNSLIQ